MLNTVVKPNDMIESEPRNILLHSHQNVSKITGNSQPYVIICLFTR